MRQHRLSPGRRLAVLAGFAVALLTAGGSASVAMPESAASQALRAPAQSRAHTPPTAGRKPHRLIRVWKIHYRSHEGIRTAAYVALPAAYGPHYHPPIPLVISPHGRGIGGRANLRLWGALPAAGFFAVVSPDGHGRVLPHLSWGYPGQIDDLARMPEILRRTLPWLRIDRQEIYAFGGSMGGQEVLLLLARHPGLLAGVAAFDPVTDFAAQYRNFDRLSCTPACRVQWGAPLGLALQQLARTEVGGTPRTARRAFARRSPLSYVRRIAWAGVEVQIWWSVNDQIVPQRHSERLVSLVKRINPAAPIQEYEGFWRHSAEMRASTRLPIALKAFNMLPYNFPVSHFPFIRMNA
ncbi:MAG: alpha/beta hydrolase family protein [Gaiellaceae bacterium]